MARVLALTADLLFGSRLQAALAAAGHDVTLIAGEHELRAALADRPDASGADVLLIDLTDANLDGLAIVSSLREQLAGAHTLAYYAHVDATVRERAQAAGIELVVPRSRIAREAPTLVAGLLAPAR